jgi:hypothetical protein
MKITNEMIVAAVKQGVKDGLLPKYADMDTYLQHYKSVERMLEQAIEAGEG